MLVRLRGVTPIPPRNCRPRLHMLPTVLILRKRTHAYGETRGMGAEWDQQVDRALGDWRPWSFVASSCVGGLIVPEERPKIALWPVPGISKA